MLRQNQTKIYIFVNIILLFDDYATDFLLFSAIFYEIMNTAPVLAGRVEKCYTDFQAQKTGFDRAGFRPVGTGEKAG